MTQETGLRQTLIGYVEDARQTGLDLREAAVSALDRVIDEGLAAEVLRLGSRVATVRIGVLDQPRESSSFAR